MCGELAVSRSIGDRDFKGFTKRRLEQGTEGVAPLEVRGGGELVCSCAVLCVMRGGVGRGALRTRLFMDIWRCDGMVMMTSSATRVNHGLSPESRNSCCYDKSIKRLFVAEPCPATLL